MDMAAAVRVTADPSLAPYDTLWTLVRLYACLPVCQVSRY